MEEKDQGGDREWRRVGDRRKRREWRGDRSGREDREWRRWRGIIENGGEIGEGKEWR